MIYHRPMKSLSVSHFKAKLAAHLREVQRGETLVITEHRRPIVRVTVYRSHEDLVEQPLGAFTLAGSSPSAPVQGAWRSLLQAERGDH